MTAVLLSACISPVPKIDLAPGATAGAGAFKIVEVQGSRLVVANT